MTLALSHVFNKLKAIFQSSDGEAIAKTFDAILSELAYSPLEHDIPVHSVLNCIKDAALKHPFITEIYLRYLCNLKTPTPNPYIEVIPTLCVYSSESIAYDVIDQLLLLLDENINLLVPVIGVWVELLPSCSASITKFHSIIEGALESIDEAEIPFLVRTLLKSYQSSQASRILSKLLKNVGTSLDFHIYLHAIIETQ